MNWKEILKAKSKAQKDLDKWTKEDWGTPEEHRAEAKGKPKPKQKARTRYMPKNKFNALNRTKRGRGILRYQGRKKQAGLKRGQTITPTGRNFSQRGRNRK